jgi:hypothetical protein
MSFNARDLRRGMDVFSADGVYLGAIVWVTTSPAFRGVHWTPDLRSHGASVSPRPPNPLSHELWGPSASRHPQVGSGRGRAQATDHGSGAAFSGESIGPMPTVALGNGGPRSQTASTGYASRLPPTLGDAVGVPATLVVVRMLTSLNWSTLRPIVRRIPVSLVQLVSLERIALSAREDELP